ncbi:MAG: LacI family DNA-binding transcriptional regulator [Candidatus Eisenbacteria bacterium]|nr:LacI family DNA-binding transcriptional regulator [Candidatus Eisenbacteria bacterium]MCC7140955.1 LacI family DNA-binding transcriptional regulator [Candidatus Eisenbacteria bacterium]
MATIRDVARVAGVSIATVSRVYNGSARVSDETRRKVRAVAAKMDYWPNGAARSLTTARTHSLGVLLPDLYGEFFSEVIRGIDHGARQAKYQILVSSSHADSDALVVASRSMHGRIDGLIAMAPDVASTAAIKQIARNFPVVLLNPRVEVEGCYAISIANFEGAHTMVRHLIAQGHERIAILKGPHGNVDAEERLRGYRSALRESGIHPLPELEFDGDFTEASGHRRAKEILALEGLPTAVFAVNDYMAIGLLSALRDAGVRVPEDIAVTGFDNIAISQYLSPPLTTVQVDAYELGQRAVQQWLLAIEPEGRSTPPRHEVLPATLVIRRSCGVARSAVPRGGRKSKRKPDGG